MLRASATRCIWPPDKATTGRSAYSDGPTSTTISPAGTAKLTPSIAGRPIENCLRRSVTSSVAVMNKSASCVHHSLPITEGLVPGCNPIGMQFHILVEIRIPDLDHLG